VRNQSGRDLAKHVGHIVTAVFLIEPTLQKMDPLRRELAEIDPWLKLVSGSGDRSTLLRRLLALEIATTTVADERPSGASFPIDLVQLSLQAKAPFADFSRTGDEKVAGMALIRFGGFLKRSWRINDWIWGRLDAASVICSAVLVPGRIRSVAVLAKLAQDGEPPSEAAARLLVDQLVDGLLHHVQAVQLDSQGTVGLVLQFELERQIRPALLTRPHLDVDGQPVNAGRAVLVAAEDTDDPAAGVARRHDEVHVSPAPILVRLQVGIAAAGGVNQDRLQLRPIVLDDGAHSGDRGLHLLVGELARVRSRRLRWWQVAEGVDAAEEVAVVGLRARRRLARLAVVWVGAVLAQYRDDLQTGSLAEACDEQRGKPPGIGRVDVAALLQQLPDARYITGPGRIVKVHETTLRDAEHVPPLPGTVTQNRWPAVPGLQP
jgi:hypothetical protein